MTITWQHINITALVAIALHVGIGLWIGALSTSAPAMAEPPPAPLRVNLLAAVAETTTNTAPEKPPIKPVHKPPVTPPKQPEPKPSPKPKPVPKPEPISKPAPKPEPIIEEIVPVPPVPISEPTPPPEQPTPELDIVEEVAPPPVATPADTPLSAAATAEYERLLVAWLEKHKKYPTRAKRMRIEGEGMLRILIDRTGRAYEITLEQRTGNRLLDKAAIEMAKRATPFPPIPEFDSRQEMEFIVPVAFALR